MVKSEQHEHLAPQLPRRRRTGVWMPLSLLVVVFTGSFIAYRNLVASAPVVDEKTAAPRSESSKAPAVERAMPPMSTFMALSPERDPAPHPDTPPAIEAPRVSEPPGAAAMPRMAKSPPVETAPVTGPAPAPADPGVASTRAAVREAAATGATQAAPVETNVTPRKEPAAPAQIAAGEEVSPILPLSKIEAAVVAPPHKEEWTVARLPVKEEMPAPSAAPRPEIAALGTIHKEQASPGTSWQRRLHSELVACGEPGRWRSDVCREAARWNYCHPNRWNTVRECAVERFASSAVPN